MAQKYKVGDVGISNAGSEFKIIADLKTEGFLVEFQDSWKFCRVFQKYAVNRGNIWNPYHPTIFGVGYFGVGKYSARVGKEVGKDKRNTKEYNAWINMLQRCYYDKYICRTDGYKIYDKVKVCNEWHNFQTFAEWYTPRLEALQHLNERRYHLDKDILSKGLTDKIYSPETCCVIPMRINAVLINVDSKLNKTSLFKGVHKKKSSYAAICSVEGAANYSGGFNTAEEAAKEYIIMKKVNLTKLADEYKVVLEPKVYDALKSYLD